MRLPRWTVYPALALLAVFLLPAVPRPPAGAPALAPAAPTPTVAPETEHPRTVVLGIDGLDPDILAETIAAFPEVMEPFARLVEEGGLHELRTSYPPQSPVAWSNFITGLNPGGHGIFDFIHRDPVTRGPVPATVTGEDADELSLWGDWQFPLGGESDSNRSGDPFWRLLARRGVPAHLWRMPINYPVEPSRGLSFSGMMTPAVDSAYGECTLYTTDPTPDAETEKVVALREFGGRIDTKVLGPANTFKKSAARAVVPLTMYVDREAGALALETGGQSLVLQPGQWSTFLRFDFDLLPLGAMPMAGIGRFYLRSLEPEIELYLSPINIDPADPISPVSAPEDASAEVAAAIGPYYTQGMPEDVNALKQGVLDDEEFMAQSALVHSEGERMLEHALDLYLADAAGGLLFFYFSGVDLCGHMMWRHADEEHPHHDPAFAARSSEDWSERAGSTWRDVVQDLYLQMAPVLARVRERVGDDARLIVMSDHGFASYRRKFSLNTWLLEEGYLVLKPGRERELPSDDPDYRPVSIVDAVDWSRTRAYGVGFNGLYLNLRGRELDDPRTPEDESGIVAPGPEADALLAELAAKLEALRDVDGRRVVLSADLARDVYRGARLAEAPDIVVGYDAGYGNSDPASLAQIPHAVLADNLGGTFNGSHLMAPEVVPGTFLTNGEVLQEDLALTDVTVMILHRYGIAPTPAMEGRPLLR